MKPYQSGHRRAQSVYIIFGILIVIFIVTMVFLFKDIELRQKLIDGDEVSYSEQEDSNDRVIVMGRICAVAGIFAGIPFLLWLYRAYANLTALGAKDLKFSIGNAVGWFLVPVFNLFRPYQIAEETWNGSNPDRVNDAAESWNKSSLFAGFWWGIFLLSLIALIFALVVFRVDYSEYSLTLAGSFEYQDDFINYRRWNIIFLFTAIMSFITTILFVRSVDRWQEKKHKLIGTSSIE